MRICGTAGCTSSDFSLYAPMDAVSGSVIRITVGKNLRGEFWKYIPVLIDGAWTKLIERFQARPVCCAGRETRHRQPSSRAKGHAGLATQAACPCRRAAHRLHGRAGRCAAEKSSNCSTRNPHEDSKRCGRIMAKSLPSDSPAVPLSRIRPRPAVFGNYSSGMQRPCSFRSPDLGRLKAGFWPAVLSAGIALSMARAQDWPQFLGPNRNGTVTEANLAAAWPKEGPSKIAERKMGQGFSGPVLAQNRLILFHRIGNRETIECLDPAVREVLWKFDYVTRYSDDFGFDDGPRATPAIADGKVYTFGAEGMLHCLDLETGMKQWAVPTQEEFRAAKGFFGMACSPLVQGSYVLLNIGGPDGAGIVAFDKNNGRLAWKATDHEASYSSPAAATIAGQSRAVFFTRTGLLVVNPDTGHIQFEFKWRPRMNASVNAATPLVIGGSIFLSTSYDTGAILLDVQGGKLQQVWASDESLSNHYATSVPRDGFLYGFHGRQEYGPSLRCVEWRTGRVRWSEDRFPAGTVTLAGESLLVLLEDGRLLQIKATPEKFSMLGQAQILPTGVRAYPALAGGWFYARSKDRLVCVDLRSSARGQ